MERVFKSFKGWGRQEAMPPLPVGNRWVRVLRGLEVVKVAADEPTGTQPDTAYSAGTRSLI